MSNADEYDFDVEDALEPGRTEEFEDNLDYDSDEPAGTEREPDLDEATAEFEEFDDTDLLDPEDGLDDPETDPDIAFDDEDEPEGNNA